MHLHEILKNELDTRFGSNKPLRIVETGTIRGTGVAAETGDGWSTQFFARRVLASGGYEVVSIDLNTKTVPMALKPEELRVVKLLEGHSIAWLAHLNETVHRDGHFDVVFLDSDNDPQLIFHEFLIAEQLVEPNGLIMIDDVAMPHHPPDAKKGAIVWPYIKERGYTHRCIERHGWADYKTGVLIIEPK